MNNGRIAVIIFAILAVVVVLLVYNLNVENREMFGKMVASATERFQQASGSSSPDKDGVPPLSAFLNVKDTSKLANFREEAMIGNLPNEALMQTMSARQLRRIYLRYLDNTDLVCSRYLRMGNIGDGGWEICDDVRWRPMGDCIMYSFGINNDFSFDDMAASTFDCHVFAFDPSMKAETHNRSNLVHFYKWGIGGADQVTPQKWQIYTVATIRKILGHAQRPIDVFKMDVEGAEWSSLPNMFATGQLQSIRQLFVEFHGVPDQKNALITRLKNLWELEQAGMRKFYSHKNPACKISWSEYPASITQCYEVYYVNTRLLNKA